MPKLRAMPSPFPRFLADYLNLLKMTAIMSRTKRVMMEIVITRFVAILEHCQRRGAWHAILADWKPGTVPTCHAPQCFHTTVDIALALEQHTRRVMDNIPLPLQVGQRVRADCLGLISQGLAVLQPLRAAIQTVGAAQQLLALLQLDISWVVAVAAAKEGGPVVRQVLELALVAIHVRLVVAEALVHLGPRSRGDVLLGEFHLVQLRESSASVSCSVLLGWPPSP